MEELNLPDLRDKCLNSLYSCTENISKYVDSDIIRNEEFSKLKNYVMEYCLMEQEEHTGMKAIKSFEKKSDFADWKSLKDQYENKLVRHSKHQSKFDNHTYLKEFEKHVNKAGRLRDQSSELDLAVTETIKSYIDPFSKRPITNPVRNTICKHVYDKESADNIISNKKNKGCPNVGCTNKKRMRAEHLELDVDLQLIIQRSQSVSQMPSVDIQMVPQDCEIPLDVSQVYPDPDVGQTLPDVNQVYSHVSQIPLDISQVYPDPDVSQISADVNQMHPLVSQTPPDVNQVYPNVIQIPPDVNQVYPHTSQVYPNINQMYSNLSQMAPNFRQMLPGAHQWLPNDRLISPDVSQVTSYASQPTPDYCVDWED